MATANLTGKRFGRLCVLRRLSYWDCLCDCGKTTTVIGKHLISGAIKSCGCLRSETTTKRLTKHGHRSGGGVTGAYSSWRHMLQRCNNPRCRSYRDYGGRGIRVCNRWRRFENFYSDMGDRPKGWSIERKNNNGNYHKRNCRWVPFKSQSGNRRNCRMIRFAGKTQTIADWARELGLVRTTLVGRLNAGWPVSKALRLSADRVVVA